MKTVYFNIELWREPILPEHDFTPHWSLFLSYKGAASECHARADVAKFSDKQKWRIVKVETTETVIAETILHETPPTVH